MSRFTAVAESDIIPDVEHRQPLADCFKCSLWDCKLVPSAWGLVHPRVAVVGSFPHYEDGFSGVPFTRRNVKWHHVGEILETALSSVRIDLRECLVTYACLCMSEADESLGLPEITACNQRLQAELRIAKPELVLALGQDATQALLQERGRSFRAQRGRLYYHKGLRIWPTHHPTRVVYSGETWRDFIQDIQKIPKILSGEITFDPLITEYEVVTEENRLVEIVDFLVSKPRVVACDLETTGLRPEMGKILTVALSWAPGKACVVPFSKSVYGTLQILFQEPSRERIHYSGYFLSRRRLPFRRATTSSPYTG